MHALDDGGQHMHRPGVIPGLKMADTTERKVCIHADRDPNEPCWGRRRLVGIDHDASTGATVRHYVCRAHQEETYSPSRRRKERAR